MVFKKVLFFFLIIVSFTLNSFSNVIYDKDNIIITEIDIKIYKDLFANNYGIKINTANALKDLALIRNVINDLEKNNTNFINKIDSEILTQFGKDTLENSNIREFIIFSKIREEFIINYFQNELTISEIKNIFNNLENLDLPISKNDCLIIDRVIDLRNNDEFVKNIYKNLKNNTKEFVIVINKKEYKVCVDQKAINSIERLIIEYIQTQTVDDFESFIYGKIKN